MHFPGLQLLHLLSLPAFSSAMAIVPKPIPQARHLRRDHGNPGLLIPSPKAQTTSIAPPATSEVPPPAAIAVSSSTPPTTVQPTTTTSLSTSTSAQLASVTTTSTSSSTTLTIPTSSTIFTPSSPPTTSTSPTITAIAPPDTSSSSASQPTTLITLCILSLILGLIGLIILVLAFMRRQARRNRARGMKREVELLKIDVGAVVPGDANVADATGQPSQFAGLKEGGVGGKWEEAGGRLEDGDEWERQPEGGSALPPYRR